jgi:aspartate-semialdehyde dehydrogenase
MPDAVRTMTVHGCTPGRGPKVVFSALDAKAADDIEHQFAAAGHVVLSNARSHRMDPLVPLLIPEVNATHLCLLEKQRTSKGWQGVVITNPNCATVVLAMALAPLRAFGVKRVSVTTMQAVSGAGYPGVPSLDILGNLIPFIGGGEEEKIETETLKILGDAERRHPAVVSAQVNRVPVIDGHTMTVSVELESRPDIGDVAEAMRAFRGRPQDLRLPTAPDPALNVMVETNRPQPRLDADLGGGMTVSVGRIRACPVLTHKFVALGHNTIRGAAGASVLNAELMKAEGLL